MKLQDGAREGGRRVREREKEKQLSAETVLGQSYLPGTGDPRSEADGAAPPAEG